uniref:glycosyltransferase family 2 protein n=1 Tax=Polynucleobacter sp. TaxID=2029855 RepID=UPI004047CA6E
MPLISICIPAYNRASVLPELFDSILCQNFADYDIVLAEDCSPERDAIAKVVTLYQTRYPGKITYHENPQTLGYDGNLRRLFELATSDYVLFMGNDDLIAPGALEAVAGVVRERNDVGVVLRSYASFNESPAMPKQFFRYFDADRVFCPGVNTIVTFFRRAVFISGMVFKRSSGLKYATSRFDGTLLYQQHLVGQILAKESGVYLNQILSYHRLGGVPDFGASLSERGRFVPKQQTPESSIRFMSGMLAIANSLEETVGGTLYQRILRDIGNYSYPILSIQADRSFRTFASYLIQIGSLGLWRVPLFYVYAVGLVVLGKSTCDRIIRLLKKAKGRAPMLGAVYAGEARHPGSGVDN